MMGGKRLALLVTLLCIVGCRRTLEIDDAPAEAPAPPTTQPAPEPPRPPQAGIPPAPGAPPPQRPESPPSKQMAEPVTRAVEVPLDPPPISLNLRDASLPQILEAFSHASGVNLRLREQTPMPPMRFPQPVYDIAIDQQPFWPAMRALTATTHFAPTLSAGEATEPGAIVLAPVQRGLAQPVGLESLSQHALILLRSIERFANLNYAAPDDPFHLLMLEITVLIDPRLHGGIATGTPEIQHAVDDQDRQITYRSRDRRMPPMMWSAVGDSQAQPWNRPLRVMLLLPAADAQRIARLRGTVAFDVATTLLHVEVDDIMSAGGFVVADERFRIVFSEVRRQGGTFELAATLTRGDVTNEQWTGITRGFSTWLREVQLLDADDQPLARVGGWSGGGFGGTRGEARVSFRAEALVDGKTVRREPKRLVWSAMPLDTTRLEIPFEFVDVPLP